MPDLAFLNGSFCSLDQAKVPIEDRGFQFADGVYEVIVFHGDRPLMLAEHLQRLTNSCREIRLKVDFAEWELDRRMREGVRRAGFEATMVYVQITRGVASRHHDFPAQCRPTVVMTFKALPQVPPAKRARGLRLLSMPDFRWSRCHIKSIALLPNVMARDEARSNGYDDALFVGPDGEIREASAANFFVISDHTLMTPPQDHTILPGITRQLVRNCAQVLDMSVREQALVLQDLGSVDEAFLSSTTLNVLGVVAVDDCTIGQGRPGKLTSAIYEQMLKQISALDYPANSA